MFIKTLSLLLSAVMLFSGTVPVFDGVLFGGVYSESSFSGELCALLEKYDKNLKKDAGRYGTRRLIARSDKKSIKNTVGADKIITDGSGLFVLQFDSESKAKAAEKALSEDSGIKEVFPDAPVRAFGDIKVRNGAHLINSDRYRDYLEANKKRSKIVVAVLDSGVDTDHDVFFGRCIKGFNAYNNNSNTLDNNGHGTHVAGIIADNTPDSVKIMPVKVLSSLGAGSEISIKLGIEYAVKHGADVINLSLGGSCTGTSCPINKAIRAAVKKGVTVVAAAGNEAADTKHTCPANMKSVITVASASQNGGKISDFSNYGASVDLAAPGENIESAYLGKLNAQMSGTSMAAPFVAAAAALVLTNNPDLGPEGVKNTLKGYCADMYTKGWDKLSGAGLLNLGIALGDSMAADKISLALPEKISMTYFKNATWYVSGAEALSSQTYENYIGEITAPSITDRSFDAYSSNSKVAVFNGKYIVPKGKGTAVITLKPHAGESTSITVTVNEEKVWTDYAAKRFGGGKGTKKKPYLIKNAAQLAKLARDVRNGRLYYNKHFKLTKNINLKGKKWISIGHYRYENSFFGEEIICDSFGGTFDGGNKKIKNMDVFNGTLVKSSEYGTPVNATWYENAGLFSAVEDSTVKRLGITNAKVHNNNSGILAESIGPYARVNCCFTSGKSAGAGLAYDVSGYDISVKNCYSSAETGRGGLFYSVYFAADETPVKISNCFFCGKQSSGNASGGFAYSVEGRYAYYPEIINCFASGKANGKAGFINECLHANLYSCYYASANSKGTSKKRGGEKVQLYAKKTAFFKRKASFTKTKYQSKRAPWDFKNTWAINKKINGGCPYLKHIKP